MYEWLTRRQAELLYKSVKREDISMSRDMIEDMFNLVGVRWYEMTAEQKDLYNRLTDSLRFLMSSDNGKAVEFAQNAIYGKDCTHVYDYSYGCDYRVNGVPGIGGYRIA